MHRAATTAEAAGAERAEAIRVGRELQRAEDGARVIWDQSEARVDGDGLGVSVGTELVLLDGFGDTGSVLLSTSGAGDSNREGDVARPRPLDP